MVEDEVYHTISTAGNKTLTNMPLSPDKTDYLFMGWYFDKDVWKNKFDANTYSEKYLTQDITVYAYFALPTEQKYTITFMVDEQEYHSIETAGHEELTFPANPEKSGYEFGGWFFDNTTFATEFDCTYYEKTTLTENVSVYAKFTEIEQSETDSGTKTISFEVDGEVYHTIATAGNETLTMPAEPYNDELTFAGWYFDNNTFLQPFTENAYSTTYLTSNVTIYAKFTPDVYQSNLEFVLSEDETYYIVVGLGECANAKNILVPDTYNGLPVKEIVGSTYDEHFAKVYDGVFYNADTLVKLKISTNVEVIGKWAVSGADKLVKVEFAENSKLHTLGDMCFNHSISLKSIVLPKGVTSLPQYAFTQCESLTSFTFEDPSTFTEFGPYALYGTAITELDIPKNTTKIGENCFSDCASLTRISLPKALKTIDTGAFNDCRKLKYVELEDTDAWCGVDIADPWGVPFIWAGGFYQNGERVKNLVISEGVKEIKQFVFADCKTLQEITIPSTVELMESCSFADVLQLKVLNYNAKNCKLNFHSSSSHYYVFEHCGAYSLTSHAPGYVYPEGAKHIIVNIGASVELLPANLFNYTAGGYQPLVKSINFLGTTPPEFGTNWIKAVSLLENVTVPTGTESTYLTALGSYYEKFLLTE